MALVAGAAFSYANEVSRELKKENVTVMAFENVKKGSVLQIKDKNGLILYKETIKAQGNYSKEFDLTALPNGAYYFELDKEVEIIEIPFKVVEGEVTFDKDSKKTIFKPVVYYNDGKMFISKMSFDAETMDIAIYYENDQPVLKDKNIGKTGNVIGKIYDFKGSEYGTYTVVIKNNGREFVNKVKI